MYQTLHINVLDVINAHWRKGELMDESIEDRNEMEQPANQVVRELRALLATLGHTVFNYRGETYMGNDLDAPPKVLKDVATYCASQIRKAGVTE